MSSTTAHAAGTFQADYQLLSKESPGWGRVAVLPWDTQIFGFPVGDYEAGDAGSVARAPNDFEAALHHWALANRVELIACSVPAHDACWVSLLGQLRFVFVDYSLQVTLPRLDTAKLASARSTVRLGQVDDLSEVERIANAAFRSGRYHADPRFPRDLAALRYQYWVRAAFSTGGQNRVYVLGETGKVRGFFHVTLKGEVADLRLAAVDPGLPPGIAGFDLYASTLRALKDTGAGRATAKIPAGHTAVMNIFAALGFRFSHAQAVFHWHAPGAPCHGGGGCAESECVSSLSWSAPGSFWVLPQSVCFDRRLAHVGNDTLRGRAGSPRSALSRRVELHAAAANGPCAKPDNWL